MIYLIISIYDGWCGFSAATLDATDNTAHQLDDVYVQNLLEIYRHDDSYYTNLISKARSLYFNGVIICEDGQVLIKTFNKGE